MRTYGIVALAVMALSSASVFGQAAQGGAAAPPPAAKDRAAYFANSICKISGKIWRPGSF